MPLRCPDCTSYTLDTTVTHDLPTWNYVCMEKDWTKSQVSGLVSPQAELISYWQREVLPRSWRWARWAEPPRWWFWRALSGLKLGSYGLPTQLPVNVPGRVLCWNGLCFWTLFLWTPTDLLSLSLLSKLSLCCWRSWTRPWSLSQYFPQILSHAIWYLWK